MERTYSAWIILSRIVSRGKILPGYNWCPMYKSIDGMLPFFTTKRQAQQWMSDRGMRSGRSFKYRVERVEVTACCRACEASGISGELNHSETLNS